jgi:putative effector of murein hydrolase
MLSVGANASITAATVVVTGLVGANFVQSTLDKLRLRDPIARGIATASRYILKIILFTKKK